MNIDRWVKRLPLPLLPQDSGIEYKDETPYRTAVPAR